MSDNFETNESAQTYLAKVKEVIHDFLGEDFLGLYLHGSAVQGDFWSGKSDLDVLGVVRDSLTDGQRSQLSSYLGHQALPVPAAGFEAILCSEEVVRAPVLELPFQFALSTGPDWPTISERPGAAKDILINLALCRQSGCDLYGTSAVEIIAPVDLNLLQQALVAELEWHRRNLTEKADDQTLENAILNAARSCYAAETGQIISKTAGGDWWLQQSPADQLVAQASVHRTAGQAITFDSAQADKFLEVAINRIVALQN